MIAIYIKIGKIGDLIHKTKITQQSAILSEISCPILF